MSRFVFIAFVTAAVPSNAEGPSLEQAISGLTQRYPHLSVASVEKKTTATIDLGDVDWRARGSKLPFMQVVLDVVTAANDWAEHVHLVVVVRSFRPLGEQVPTELMNRCAAAQTSTWGWLARNSKNKGQFSYEVRCVSDPNR